MKKVNILSMIIIILTSCSLIDNSSDVELGSCTVEGYVFFNNISDHQDIDIFIKNIDQKSVQKSTTSDSRGYYLFECLQPGNYTIYASSIKSKEKSVQTNISVDDGREITASVLELTAVGELSGRVQVYGSNTGNLGYFVMLVGTSYIAVTNENGEFNITDIPVSNGYTVMVTKDNYLETWEMVYIEAGINTNLGSFYINLPDENDINGNFSWQGTLDSHPENPEKFWAYYNVTDNISYIYDGEQWQIIAVGAVGNDGLSAYEIWLSLGNSGTEEDFIASIANPETNMGNNSLVAKWMFTGDANDTSGNNYHGVVYGATLTTDRNGTENSAYSFDGIDDYMDIGQKLNFGEDNSAMTITCWIKPDTLNNWQNTIISERETDNYQFAIMNDYPYFSYWESNGDETMVHCDAVTIDYTWQFLAVTYNGSETKFYYNGELIYQEYTTGIIASNSATFTIGKIPYNQGDQFNGKIDDIRIYNSELTSSEISYLYNLD